MSDFELNLSCTGARVGDVLVGRQKCTMDAKLRVYKEIFPQAAHIDELKEEPRIWKIFINKLANLPFFAKMTIEEREKWLEENQVDDDGYIRGDCEAELLDAGKSTFTTQVDSEDLEKIMAGNINNENGRWTFDELQSFFPHKPGSKAKHQTLAFIKGFWKVAVDYKIVSSYEGIIFDIENGCIVNKYTADEDYEIIQIEGITKTVKTEKKKGWVKDKKQDIAFIVPKDRFVMKDMDDLICSVYSDFSNDDNNDNKDNNKLRELIKEIRYDFREYTAGAFKSEMQKIIRFSAEKASLLNGKIIDCDLLLCVVVGMLAENPGSFVPDIQRYVTGLESVGKRLGVICGFEDVYTPPEKIHNLVSLFSGALLAQRVRSWKPNRKILEKWMKFALESKHEGRCCDYDCDEGLELKPFTLSVDLSPIKCCSALIDELRTFEGDIGMMRYISEKYENIELLSYSENKGVMPLSHGTDQHWATGLVYYYSPDTIKDAFYDKKKITAPHQLPDSKDCSSFGKMFKKIFRQVCGVNPRRHPHFKETFGDNDFEEDEFVVETRFAQKMFLMSKQNKTIKRKTIKGKKYSFYFTLDNSWLAGLVGAIEIKGNPAAIVTMRPDDPYQLIAIRKPARDMADHITPQREEQAKKIAREMLKKGIVLNAATAPCEFLDQATVRLDDEDCYVIEKDNIIMSWEEVRELYITLPYHNTIDKTIENAITYSGEGIEKNAFDKLKKLIEKKDKDVVYRALSYICNYKSEFEMNRISRDGNGTYQAVNLNDVEAYQLLLTISQIFPAALRSIGSQKFQVPVGPLLWTIVDFIKKHISEKDVSSDDGWDEFEFEDELERTPWKHQIDTCEEMCRNFKAGTKASFLWLLPGLGKTRICMEYMKWLKTQNKLPKYILYTLPPSAVKSVVHEIQAFGLDINYIIPLKSIKNKVIPKGLTVSQECKLKPFAVNIIVHDHMRRCVGELVSYANECMFLVDEVHKALNETKRTTACLDIARLSKMFVVFTGTPIIDNSVYKLIWWLEQIVQFEVNLKNFWVSANSIVARKVVTGVRVNHKELVAKFNKKELQSHKKLMPVAMGGDNQYATINDFQDASKICYQACSRRMIEETLRMIDKGVMLVAQNKNHQEILKQMLLQEDIEEQDIYILDGNDSIFLTDEEVKKKKIHDYKVVIVPLNKCEGYTLTRLASMVISVYPSNEASRQQISGRINRIGQKAKEIEEVVVHCGILTHILKHHNDAKSLSIALSDMAKTVAQKF